MLARGSLANSRRRVPAYDDEHNRYDAGQCASALAFLARSLKGDEKRVVEEATLATAETPGGRSSSGSATARRASPPRPPTRERTVTNINRRQGAAGGAITVPVDIATLPPDDRRRILENDERASTRCGRWNWLTSGVPRAPRGTARPRALAALAAARSARGAASRSARRCSEPAASP